jgi:hypothetical protein
MVTPFAIVLALLAAAAGLFGRAGIEVNGQRYAWRNYYKFLGLTFGRWQTLPPIKGVITKHFSSIISQTPGTIGSIANWHGTALKDEQIIVMLSVTGAQNGIVLRTVSYSELVAAEAFAQEVAKELRVPVLDYLSPHLTSNAV